MFRSRIKELAALVEYDILDLRRTPAYWDERLGKETPSHGKGNPRRKKHCESDRQKADDRLPP
jgi:hypothetical protein